MSANSHRAPLDTLSLGELVDVAACKVVLDDSPMAGVELVERLANELVVRGLLLGALEPGAEGRRRRSLNLGESVHQSSPPPTLSKLLLRFEASDPPRPANVQGDGKSARFRRMSENTRAAWQAFVRGHEAAARAAASVRRPVPPEASFRRLVALRRLARQSRRSVAESDEENLLFHLRLRELRKRLLG